MGIGDVMVDTPQQDALATCVRQIRRRRRAFEHRDIREGFVLDRLGELAPFVRVDLGCENSARRRDDACCGQSHPTGARANVRNAVSRFPVEKPCEPGGFGLRWSGSGETEPCQENGGRAGRDE
ncbi:MAG: hypothetical protein U0Q16_16445 [Bryobacteraceae bacterium]